MKKIIQFIAVQFAHKLVQFLILNMNFLFFLLQKPTKISICFCLKINKYLNFMQKELIGSRKERWFRVGLGKRLVMA